MKLAQALLPLLLVAKVDLGVVAEVDCVDIGLEFPVNAVCTNDARNAGVDSGCSGDFPICVTAHLETPRPFGTGEGACCAQCQNTKDGGGKDKGCPMVLFARLLAGWAANASRSRASTRKTAPDEMIDVTTATSPYVW